MWEDNGFVITNETGGPLHINSLTSQYEKLIEAAQVPRIRFHDSRQTSAALLLTQDIHPKFVQERMGHTNSGMTVSRYSHAAPGMQREAAEALDRAIQEDERTGEASLGENKQSDAV